jgi:hypothetical protein
MKMNATDIMNNIIQLAELLDEETLKNAADVPILELAKSVSIKKLKPWKAQKTELASGSLPPGPKPDEAGASCAPPAALQAKPRHHHTRHQVRRTNSSST